MVETYKGPMPQFSKSPTSEATQGLSSRAQQRVKRSARQPEGTYPRAQSSVVEPANDSRPTTGAQHQQTHTYRSATAGPTSHGQKIVPRLTNTSGQASNLLLQQSINPSSASVGDFFGLNASSTGLGSGDFDFSAFDFSDDNLTSTSLKEPAVSESDFGNFLVGQQETTQQAYGVNNALNNAPEAPMGHANAGVSSPSPLNFIHNTPPTPGTGLNISTSNTIARVPQNIPDLPTFPASMPLQSVKQEQEQQPTTQAVQPGILPPPPPPNQPPGFPPGYTAPGAVFCDAHGVWYYDPHDDCHIALGHRHDWDGGVHFSCDVSVAQSFAGMHGREGVGFLLGLAAGQVVHGGSGVGDGVGEPALGERLRAVTEVARGTLPEEAQAGVAVPSPEVVEGLMGVNERLPGNRYYEPFTDRVVRYDMPAGLASRNGKRGEDGGGHNPGTDSSYR